MREEAKCKMQNAKCKMQNGEEVFFFHFAFCILHSAFRFSLGG